MVANGYTDYETLSKRIEKVLDENGTLPSDIDV
jgi:hypothetical protein